MSDIENENQNPETEAAETVEVPDDVTTAEQPEGSEPADVPAAEATEDAPAAEADSAEAEAAEETPAAPDQPAKRKRSLKHVPRSARRTRTKKQRANTGERKAIVRLEKPEHERGRRQERRGVVVSDAMDKTIVVKIESVRAHQRYKKVIRRSVKFHAHDEQNQAHVGDIVRIVETKPLSKTKRWRLAEVIEVAK
jgi:small subunit ribosomal protein S17